jgi:GAF domain-containing protein
LEKYAEWTKEALVHELYRRAGEEIAATSALALFEKIHVADTDFMTVDSSENIFNKMLEQILGVTQCEYGFIDEMFVDDEGKRYLEARAFSNIAWDQNSRELYKKILSGEMRFGTHNSLYGEVLKSGTPFYSNDAPNDPKKMGVPSGHPPLSKFLGIPLYACGEFVGVLGLANPPQDFSDETVRFLEPLTKISSLVLINLKTSRANKIALDQYEEKVFELERFNRFAVDRELRMIELKEEVNQLCQDLGRTKPYDLRTIEKAKDENGPNS